MQIPTVGDEGELPSSLPSLFFPDVPLTWSTLTLIAPYALAMALVGLLESLLTAKLVDDITDTHSNKTREAWGQGVANVVTGFFGGMGGCAMIGQQPSPRSRTTVLVQTVTLRPRLVHRRSKPRSPARQRAVLGWDACSPRPWTRRSSFSPTTSARSYVKEPSVSSSRADAEFVAGAARQRARLENRLPFSRVRGGLTVAAGRRRWSRAAQECSVRWRRRWEPVAVVSS